MGFLKRLRGSETTVAASTAPAALAGPGPYTHPSGGVFDTIACPYCGVRLEPIPRAKRDCRACGRAVYVRAGEFGIRRIVREGEEADPNAEAEYQAAQEYTAQRPVRPGRLRDARRARLRRAAALGVRMTIKPTDADRTCPACQALAGREYAATEAPILPYDRCTASFACDCKYDWVLPIMPPAPALIPGEPTG